MAFWQATAGRTTFTVQPEMWTGQPRLWKCVHGSDPQVIDRGSFRQLVTQGKKKIEVIRNRSKS
jgi:hypothetical protein